MLINYEEIEPSLRYKITSNSVIPRAIAWIVTQDDTINVAPFSYFTPLSSNPPVLIVSIGHKSDGSPKDTLANIRKTKKCTICIADDERYEKLHFSSKELDKSQSEAELFGIELKSLQSAYPPIIKDIPIAFFCTLYEEIELKGSKTIPVILKIEYQYINDNIISDKEKMHFDFKPLARVGANYAKLGEKIISPKIP